jgi:U-box domain
VQSLGSQWNKTINHHEKPSLDFIYFIMSNMSDQREGRSVEGEYGAGPQMKRARKTGVSTTRSVEPPAAPPLHSSVSAATSSAFKCKVEIDDYDNLSITSTTPMSEECFSLEGVVEECNNSVAAISDASATAVDTSTAVDKVPPLTPPSFVPRGFRCPLSWQIMLDPVLDGEGNTYEYSAILDWLKVQGHCTSPISHQPLSERMLNPNNSLREAIHEYMGSEWVRAASRQREEQQQQQQQEQEKTQTILNASICNMSSSDTSMDSTGEHQPEQQQEPRLQSRSSPHRESIIAAVADPDQRSRQKIDCFLQFVLLKIDGLKSLSLDEYGCCAFQYDGIMIVIDVPLKTGTFCFYTRNLVPYEPTEAMKDLLLELNFLQGTVRPSQNDLYSNISYFLS